jgi:flagellar FliJ protein
MKAFHFSLQRVLEVKKIKEDLRKRDLAQAIKDEEQEWKVLFSLQKKERVAKDALSCKTNQVINPAEMAMYHLYLQQIAEEILAQYDKIDDAKEEVKTKRDQLIEASKEKEAMQKLRAKRWEEYTKSVEKEERVFLDEVAARIPRKNTLNS